MFIYPNRSSSSIYIYIYIYRVDGHNFRVHLVPKVVVGSGSNMISGLRLGIYLQIPRDPVGSGDASLHHTQLSACASPPSLLPKP